MAELKFNNPYNVSRTLSSKEYLPNDYKRYYSTHYSIVTKFGIVLMSEMDWETNFNPDIFTHLTTVFNGVQYSAFLDKSKLSDIRRKWIATHFIKTIKHLYSIK